MLSGSCLLGAVSLLERRRVAWRGMVENLVPGLVSIGMSAYNSEETIEQAILSLLTQTERNIEISIIDAHSTDETPRICERLAQEDSRIRFRHLDQQRRWYLNARDHLAEARGEYFMWADADDLWSPGWVKELKALLSDGTLGAAFGILTHIDSESRLMTRHIANGRSFDFASIRNDGWRTLRYIAEPEAAGKTNLVYSLWRTDVLRGLEPWIETELSRDLDVFFLARAIRTTRIGSSKSCTVFRRIPTVAEPPGPIWNSTAGQQSWRQPDVSRLLLPASWRAWKVEPGYRHRYAERLHPTQRLPASLVLRARSCVAWTGQGLSCLRRAASTRPWE